MTLDERRAAQPEIGVVVGAGAPLSLRSLADAIHQEPDMVVLSEASTPGTAVADAERLVPDVTVLHFEGTVGIDVCATMKAAETPTRVLVIAMTEGPQQLMSAVEAGADGFVAVENGLVDVLAAVRQLYAGQAWIPPAMLGTLLGDLIHRRRAENTAAERIGRLSRRELEVLAGLADGTDPRVIAERMFLSPNTVRTHVQNLMQKLEVHSRLEAVRVAMDAGVLGTQRHNEA